MAAAPLDLVLGLEVGQGAVDRERELVPAEDRLPDERVVRVEERLDHFRRHRLKEVAVRAGDSIVPLPFELPKRCRIDRPRGAPPSNNRPRLEDVVLAP